MKLSIVTTLYYSEDFIVEFYNRILKSIKKITNDYEIIFINDGSPDESLKKCIELKKSDDKIKIIDFSRNFGHHYAIKAGLDYAIGDYIFLIDSDLEEEPELLNDFYDKLINEKPDVVYGVQNKRSGTFFKQISGHIFYLIFSWLCDFRYVKNVMTVRLMNKNYVDNLKKFKENQLEIFGLFFLNGFNQSPINVNKEHKGSTTYSFKKEVSIGLQSIISFSKKPLELIFTTGLLTLLIAFLAIIFVLYNKYLYGAEVEGWVSILLSIWFLGGVTIFSLGILGLYFSKLFLEVKGRPSYIVKNIY